MAPNLEEQEHFNNCAIPFIENVVNVKNNVSSNASSGETISLASRRQERLRSNSDEGASPVLRTIARETYNLDRYVKNAMLLIHNNCYDSSDKTADKVKTTFEKLRFEVEVLDNRNGEEILSAVHKFFGRDFTEYGGAAVVVVCPETAYGNFKTQTTFFTDDDIVKHFRNGLVTTLEGKPKIFISETNQLCFTEYENRFQKPRDEINIRFRKRIVNLRGRRVMPPNFLRDLCENLEQFADTKHFLEIVNNMIDTQVLPYYSFERSNYIKPMYDYLEIVNLMIDTQVLQYNSFESSNYDYIKLKPMYSKMDYLSKELWLWKTA